MTKRDFTPSEWKLLVNAPQWVYAALAAAERGTVSTRRKEAKELDEFLSGYRTRSVLVKEIIAAQEEADDKVKISMKKAEQALADVDALLARKAAGEEGESVREMLMDAGKAVAEATREALFGDAESAKETKALARIEAALGATEADRNRRRAEEAKAKAEAMKREREAKARAEAARERAEAAKAEAEAKKKAEAEAKKKAEEAKKKAEAEAKKKADAAKRKAEAEAKAAELRAKQAEARARREAAAKAREEAEAAEERIYVVKKGDTLSHIAKELLGKAGRWPEIFEANKDVIENPNLIRPGWKLRIPEK